MTDKQTGGAAFPGYNETETQYNWVNKGMTLRDYFAAKAMMVLMRNDETDMEEDARDAYMMADYMLKARSQ